mgnify:CR=1 FL=1
MLDENYNSKRKTNIEEDLKFHPNSLIREIAQRLPNVEFNELQKMVKKMANAGDRITHDGGKKYRRYRLT